MAMAVAERGAEPSAPGSTPSQPGDMADVAASRSATKGEGQEDDFTEASVVITGAPLAHWEPIDWTVALDKVPLTKKTDISYELEIQRNPRNLRLWLAYLRENKTSVNEVRFVIYERAVKALPRSYKLWYNYLQERLASLEGCCITSEEYKKTNNCFERCLVHLSQMPRLWIIYCQFLEKQKFITRTRRAYDRALQCLPITQHHRLWGGYVSFALSVDVPVMALAVYRRYLMLHPEKVMVFIDLLKKLGHYDEAAVVLARTVDNDDVIAVEGKTAHQLWMDLCELITAHPAAIKSIDIEKVIRSGLRRFTDEVARLWCALARHFILLGHMEKAGDVFEEAVESVSTLHDFGVVFEAYAKFEEMMISKLMEDTNADSVELELHMTRLEALMDRRPVLVSSVRLRQNPHNVLEWLNRVKIFAKDPVKVVRTFTEAVVTVDPYKAVGRVPILWIKFAQFYEAHGDLENARGVLEKATNSKFKSIEDLASMWCEWVEMELRLGEHTKALEVARRSIHRPPPRTPTRTVKDDSTAAPGEPTVEEKKQAGRGYHQGGVFRSVRLWSLCADMEEAFGTMETLRACFSKMFDLKVITTIQVLSYAAYLEEKRFWEESFRVYERGVAAFRWPHVYDIWLTYLSNFVSRFRGRKLERARELFEQAVSDIPPHLARRVFLMYGKLEEEYGLAKHAVRVYERAAKIVEEPQEKFDMFSLLIAKTSELFGITKTRPVFELAIESFSSFDINVTQFAVKMALRYADIEKGLGETDRARAVLQHASQFCDPSKEADFWQHWRNFEIAHGNEDTFRDMLRTKRSVQAQYTEDVSSVIAAAAAAGGGGATTDSSGIAPAAAAAAAPKPVTNPMDLL